jgi:NADH dehydrogenase
MILVIGGTGFVGAGIVRELARTGKPVAVLSRNPERHSGRLPGLNVEWRQGDVTLPETLGRALAGVETVVGCQQFPNSPIEDPTRGYTFELVDAVGTENVVAAARSAGVNRYVYLSGVGADPNADRHWFRAKARAEAAVRDSGMNYTILRPSWVYGPEDKSLNRFLRMSRFLPFVPLIGDAGKQRLQPVFIDDVSRAAAQAVDSAALENKTFEIGGPEVLTMKEIVASALEASGRKRVLLPGPLRLMKLVASVLQFLPGKPLSPAAIDFITADALADPTEVQRALGWPMTPLREALATYLGA